MRDEREPIMTSNVPSNAFLVTQALESVLDLDEIDVLAPGLLTLATRLSRLSRSTVPILELRRNQQRTQRVWSRAHFVHAAHGRDGHGAATGESSFGERAVVCLCGEHGVSVWAASRGYICTYRTDRPSNFVWRRSTRATQFAPSICTHFSKSRRPLSAGPWTGT